MARRVTTTRPVKAPGVFRLSAVLAIGLAAGLAAWLLTSGGSGHPSSSPSAGARGPAGKRTTVLVSEQGLKTLARAVRQPIYWAGQQPGYRLELTREADGRVFVRYLPAGTHVGANKPLVTVGTYPLKNAYSVTQAVAAKSGSVTVRTPTGIAFYSRATPTNVYLAFPASDVQVEVYDPWAPGARRLVESGAVAPVPAAGSPQKSAGQATAPEGLTLAALRSFARRIGHPVYWIGARPGTTYEVTRTADGRVFVRYLPSGTEVGADRPYLTVGTYPVANALQVTRGLASGNGSARLQAAPGAVAFYARSRPTNIYEAFPGVHYQVEVYDPSSAEGRRLVRSNRVVPIS